MGITVPRIIHSDSRRLVLVLDLYHEQECIGAQIPSRAFLLSLVRSAPCSPHTLGQELYLSYRRCWPVSWLSSTKGGHLAHREYSNNNNNNIIFIPVAMQKTLLQ